MKRIMKSIINFQTDSPIVAVGLALAVGLAVVVLFHFLGVKFN